MLTLPAGRTSKFVVLALAMVFFGGLAFFAGKFESVQKNESSSWLPGDAESVKALKAVQQLPGGELAPAVVVFERESGLTARDRETIGETQTLLNHEPRKLVLEAQAPIYSENGKSALIIQPVQPGEGIADTFQTAVESIRHRVPLSQNGLEVKVTGPAGYSLDAI